MRTCTVDGVEYESQPLQTDEIDIDCLGCAGEGNSALCEKLDDCVVPHSIIWVKKEAPAA